MSSPPARRLLAVSWEMPPLAGPRAVQVSRTLTALARRGWASTIVCVEPRPAGPLLRDGGAEPFEADAVDVERVPSPEESGWARAAFRLVPPLGQLPDRQRLWIAGARRAASCRIVRDRYDVVVSFAQPWSDHLVGLQLHRMHRLPWVAHFSDPWSDSPYLRGPAWLRARSAKMESEVVREADAIIFTNEQAADVVMRKYPSAWRRRAHVVPHGYDRAQLAYLDAVPARAAGRLRLVYTGRFYDRLRTPGPLLEAVAKARAVGGVGDELELLLVGPGMRPYEMQARRLGLERVVLFGGRRLYREALRIAATADALLVIDAPSRGASLFLPSKLIDYLMLRKPILGLTPREGASADLLRRAGCVVVPPDDVDAIAQALTAFAAAWRGRTLEVSAPFDAVAAEYDIDCTTAQFARVLDACL